MATDIMELLAKADVKILMGKREEALRILRMVVALDPEQAGAWVRICRMHVEAQNIDLARGAVDEAMVHCPEHAELLVESGVVLLMEGELVAAGEAFEDAIDIDDNCAEAYAQLGVIHLALEELDEAAAVLAEAAELAPDRHEFRYQLAMVQLSRGDPSSAEEQLHKISARLPDSPSVQLDLAVMELAGGRYGEALARLDELLQGDPINVRAKYYRYVALGHLVQSIQDGDEDTISDAANRFVGDKKLN